MGGLLVVALGIALAAWQIRALTERTPTYPRLFRSRLGSGIVFSVAGACILLGGLVTWTAVEAATPQLVVFGATAALAVWGISALRSKVTREFKRDCDEFIRENPGLDAEAMYRYVVKKRHPEWDTVRILRVTEECSSLAEFARRLKREEGNA